MYFTEFTESIVELLQRKMGDGYKVTAAKNLRNNNVTLTGVMIMEKTNSISPTFYLKEFYTQYQEGTALEELVETIVEAYKKHASQVNLDIDFFQNYASVKERIYHKLINYEKNQEMLQDVPHFRWLDLAIVFYYSIKNEALGNASILIHNNHLEKWGQQAEEVYRTACRNMKEHMPEILIPLVELIGEMTGIQLDSIKTLYVLSNKEKIFGASAMLYSEKIKELADKLHSDLLILPSSVHEGATRFAA